MRDILILFTLALMSNFGIAQNGAKIEFKVKDNTLDYGLISNKKDNGIRTIEFKNTGDVPLLITNVFSTSGFTFPTKPTEPILPGKTGKIDVKYNLITGPIRKTIIIESNAVNYENGIIALKIKGIVVLE